MVIDELRKVPDFGVNRNPTVVPSVVLCQVIKSDDALLLRLGYLHTAST